MESNKLLSMLGLCKRAGFLLEGYEVVVDAAKYDRLPLLLTAKDLSPNSLRKLSNAIEQSTSKHTVLPLTMSDLEQRLGRRVGILGVADQGFATAIGDILAVE